MFQIGKASHFFASGTQSYISGQGSRVVRQQIHSDGAWLDPSTVRLTLKNNGAAGTVLRPIGGPWSFFKRARLLAGGTLIEDIDYYARVHEMKEILSASDSRLNEEVEGFGIKWDNEKSKFQNENLINGVSGESGGNKVTVCCT